TSEHERRERVRARTRLVAVSAIFVLVGKTALSGYISVWAILAVAFLVVVGVLASSLRLVALLGGMAVVFGAATVFVADMLQGNAEARALAVSIAGVVVPVLVSDKVLTKLNLENLDVTGA